MALIAHLALLFLVASVGIHLPAQAAPKSECGPTWMVEPSPNVGTLDNTLHAVDATSDDDAWAVGYYRKPTLREVTLALHWDGTTWSVVPTPNVSNNSDYLDDVDARAPDDAWAVGLDGTSPPKTLAMHWDGTSWAIISTPAQSSDARLYGVASVASDDAWAVGYHIDGHPRTLTERWNGKSWAVVSSPNVGNDSNSLRAVDARSPDDVWAVGSYYTTGSRPLAMHWDGAAWMVVPVPDPGAQTILEDVVAVGPTDVWAVGFSGGHPYSVHWDGIQWTIVPVPDITTGSLRSVVARSPTDVWAAGSYFDGTNKTLIEHWDGSSWTQVASPNPSSIDILFGIAATPLGRMWAVGYTHPAGSPRNLIEGACPGELPRVTGFSPQHGRVGTPVLLTGSAFTGATAVRFNGTDAPFIVDSDAEITTEVPPGATTGLIEVTTSFGTGSSESAFNVRPSVRSFTPLSGPVGTEVTIKGTAFTGASSVTFNDAPGTFVVLSYTKIRAVVPVGASTGPIQVTTSGGTGSSKTDFLVT